MVKNSVILISSNKNQKRGASTRVRLFYWGNEDMLGKEFVIWADYLDGEYHLNATRLRFRLRVIHSITSEVVDFIGFSGKKELMFFEVKSSKDDFYSNFGY